MVNPVFTELDDSGEPIRIFRNAKQAAMSLVPVDRVQELPRALAVKIIRRKVFDRARNKQGTIECEDCGCTITWDTGEMHEVIHKGRGGEVSLENGRALCRGCHTGRPDSRHGERRWHSARIDR